MHAKGVATEIPRYRFTFVRHESMAETERAYLIPVWEDGEPVCRRSGWGLNLSLVFSREAKCAMYSIKLDLS